MCLGRQVSLLLVCSLYLVVQDRTAGPQLQVSHNRIAAVRLFHSPGSGNELRPLGIILRHHPECCLDNEVKSRRS